MANRWPRGRDLDNLIAEKKSVPMIVVMPAVTFLERFNYAPGENTMGRDAFNDVEVSAA